MKFNSTLVESATAVWGYYLLVPEQIAKKMINRSGKRVLCSINGSEPFQSGLMPEGEGNWFVNVNKKLRQNLRLNPGDKVEVSLTPDQSQYGLPMPESFEELLSQDKLGHQHFHALTAGKQRNLIYLVGQVKSESIQIRRALVILNHLKTQDGKVDFKLLNQAIKTANEAARRKSL